MKIIGLIGGTSWQSTTDYYKIINETVDARLKNNHSAKLILNSLDFAEIEYCVNRNAFEEIGVIMVKAARSIENAGADCVLLCANTMHMFDKAVAEAVSIPLIHIAEATINMIKQRSITKLGLLGTKITMEMDFYKQKYIESGLDIMIPDDDDRKFVNSVIFSELFKGNINPDSKARLIEIIEKFKDQGVQGVILGCTELPLIIKQDDTSLLVFDTTEIHAQAAVDFALKGQASSLKNTL